MAGTTRPASLARVERIERDLKNLQLAFAAQTELIVELRDQLGPTSSKVLFSESFMPTSSPAVRRGRRVGG